LFFIFNYEKMNFCESSAIAVGLPKCDVIPGQPVLLVFTPADFALTQVQQEDLLHSLQQQARHDSAVRRIYPVGGIKQVEAANTEAAMGTLAGYGYQEKLADAVLGDKFSFPMSLCRAKALKTLDGFSGRVLIFTSNGIMLCSRYSDGRIAGIPAPSVAISISGLTKDGANVKTVSLSVTYGTDAVLLKSIHAIKYDFDVDELTALQAVRLRRTANFMYKVETTCGGVELFDYYSAELAQTSLWKAVDMLTGADLTVAAVNADASSKSFGLTLSPAPAGAYRIAVSLAAQSALIAAGIDGYDLIEPLVDNGV
jgi:hypothetical protein